MNSPLTYSICIDKLALNLQAEHVFNHSYITKLPVSGNAHVLTQDVLLRLDPILTRLIRNYAYTWEVWIEGIKVGHLSTDSLLPRTATVQRFAFENAILYTAPGWVHYFLILASATGLQCIGLSLLDVALDFQPKNRSLDARVLLTGLDDTYKYLPRKYNTDIRYKCLRRNLKIYERDGAYYFGAPVTSSSSSGKQLAIYYKSAEIEHSGKDYISAFHQQNGLDTDRPVVRVEARFSSKQLDLPCFSENGSFTPDWFTSERLESLFVGAVGQSLQFSDLSQGERDAHRNMKYAVISLMDFDFLNQQPIMYPMGKARSKSNHRANGSTVKRLTHELICYGASETLAELHRFTQANPAPDGVSWERRIKQNAHSYPDAPNPEQMQRLESISQRLRL